MAQMESDSKKCQPQSTILPGLSFSYSNCFTQWWNCVSPLDAEHQVLSLIPFICKAKPAPTTLPASLLASENQTETQITADPYGPREWRSTLVDVSSDNVNKFLNEFSIERIGEETKHNIVLLHGYGAGLGFYYKNFEPLSRRPNWKLYALDLLGMGRSSRPQFSIKAKDTERRAREVEGWFIDALEQWRIKRGIDKMTLLGHSFGAYMAVCYALKYPGHLDKLILASPVGVPDPYEASKPITQPTPKVQKELVPVPLESMDEAEYQQPSPGLWKPPFRHFPQYAASIGSANFSPLSLIRIIGPLGPLMVSNWTSKRFANVPPQEQQALHNYSYSLFRQPASGEYALSYILVPGAYARFPLIHRIQGVGRQMKETGVPIVFLYGDRDWMDKQGALDCEKKIQAEKERTLATATPEQKALENGSVRTRILRNAGHHLFIDAYEEFNKTIGEEMKDVEEWSVKMRESKI